MPPTLTINKGSAPPPLNINGGGSSTTNTPPPLIINSSQTPTQFQAQQDKVASDQANSFGGILKNTITGLGQASGIPQMFKAGVDQAKTGGLLNRASGVATAISSPLAPLLNPVNKVISYASDKVTDIPAVQKASLALPNLPYGQLAKTAGDIGNVAGVVSGGLGLLEKVRPTGIATSEAPPLKINEPASIETPKSVVAQESQVKTPVPRPNLYEPYIPAEKLPTIQMGAKAKSVLPTIQIGEKTSATTPNGELTYEPIKEAPQLKINQEPSQVTTVTPSPEGVLKPIESKGPNETKPTDVPLEPSKAPSLAINGSTASKIGKSIETKAVETGLAKMEGVAGYDKITIKDQAQRATDLVTNNLDQARTVIRGDQPLPEGLRGTALITAMEEHIKQNPSGELANELANSHLVSGTSAAAQEMRLMAERTPDSATAKLQEIKKAKLEGVDQKAISSQKKSLAAETSKVNLPKEELSWDNFLEKIQC